MSQFKEIKVEVRSKLAIISFNRPKKKNSFNADMYEEVTKVLNEISENENISITALTGVGDYYSSGTDLDPKGISSMEEFLSKSTKRVREFVNAFINHKKILVAVVNGPAIGIAVTTLGLCDVVYCSDEATFQTPFTRLGLVAEGCSSYLLPRIMGISKNCISAAQNESSRQFSDPAEGAYATFYEATEDEVSKANEMLLFNYKLTAAEALKIGFVAQVYTKNQINSKLWPELEKNSELPIKSMMFSKELMRHFVKDKFHEANSNECTRLEERFSSDEFFSAIMKFRSRSKL